KAGSYPAELSGGQQQRVAIARSLAMRPKVMLFDEATSALDPEVIHEVLNVMLDLAREGMTMVVVTHEMGFAREVAGRVVFVDCGPLSPRATDTELAIKPTEQPGLHHVAFTFGSMGQLVDTYVRLREAGIRPFFCVNHGPTTSMYYRDPDGNRVELQIDNFATAEEGQDWMLSPAFDQNPIGVEYDPDILVERFRSGVPVAELVVRDG